VRPSRPRKGQEERRSRAPRATKGRERGRVSFFTKGPDLVGPFVYISLRPPTAAQPARRQRERARDPVGERESRRLSRAANRRRGNEGRSGSARRRCHPWSGRPAFGFLCRRPIAPRVLGPSVPHASVRQPGRRRPPRRHTPERGPRRVMLASYSQAVCRRRWWTRLHPRHVLVAQDRREGLCPRRSTPRARTRR
jgi:hypothetical protein